MHELRKKLIRKKEFNPFSEYYNEKIVFEEVQNYMDNNSETKESIGLVNTLLTTSYLHKHFKETFAYLKDKILKSNLSIQEIISFSISSVNRNYLIVKSGLINKLKEQKEIKINSGFGQKILSMDPSIGEIDAVRALEGLIDSLNLLCTYVGYFVNEKPNQTNVKVDLKSIETIKALNLTAGFLDILKSEYDKCAWNGGYTEIDFETKRIDFRFYDRQKLMLKQIGFFRLSKNITSLNHTMKLRIDNDKSLEELYKKHYRKNKRTKRIKSVIVENGYIIYKLGSGEDKEEFEEELNIDNEFITFYNFILNTEMPLLENMKLEDIIKLFSVTQQLFRKVSFIEVNNYSVYTIVDFEKFAHKIKIEDLKKYLLQRTTYSSKQVKEFLELMTCPEEKRINFWNYPFIKQNEDFLFPLMALTSPITTVLADKWLEDGGFNLDDRGKLFEKYILKTITEDLHEKKYYYHIPQKKILSNFKGSNEEIDLFINLKNVCLIAEVKCIKFAINARDEHNAIKRLEDGAEQVIRKAKFIEINSKELIKDIGEIHDKKLIKVVITNYPIYSGYVLKGVPIIDFFMLESYIIDGTISNQRIKIEDGRFVSRETLSEKILYSNEKEFCDNFEGFIFKPPHIYDNAQFFQYNESKITPEMMDWKIFTENVEYL